MNDYEPWLQAWVPEGGTIAIDVGANIGRWTHPLSARFKTVIAIEPNPEALRVLRENLPGNVALHEWAAWSEETQVSFARYADSGHLSSRFTDMGIGTGPRLGTIELPARQLDSLPLTEKVDFIKIDVEGAEIDVLLGAEQLLARDWPALLIECHTLNNYFGLARMLADWRYCFTIIRHPGYALYSQYWFEHCWFSALRSPYDK